MNKDNYVNYRSIANIDGSVNRGDVIDGLIQRAEQGKSLRLTAMRGDNKSLANVFDLQQTRLPLFTSIIDAREQAAHKLRQEGNYSLADRVSGYNCIIPSDTTFNHYGSLDSSDVSFYEETPKLLELRDQLRPRATALITVDAEPVSSESLAQTRSALESYQQVCHTIAYCNQGLISHVLKLHNIKTHRHHKGKRAVLLEGEATKNYLTNSLIDSAVGFDASTGLSFSTYAVQVATNALRREQRDRTRKNQRLPTQSESDLGKSNDWLQAPIITVPIDPVERSYVVREALDLIDSQAREVLELRLGLNGRKPQTLVEVGRTFNLSKERIRQIQEEGLEAMRKGPLSEDLYDLVDSH